MFQAIETQDRNITFQDGATRSIEAEVMEMSKNSMMQRFAVELMSAQMGMLQAAISERV
jgi:flagellar basal body rod protein FlgB